MIHRVSLYSNYLKNKINQPKNVNFKGILRHDEMIYEEYSVDWIHREDRYSYFPFENESDSDINEYKKNFFTEHQNVACRGWTMEYNYLNIKERLKTTESEFPNYFNKIYDAFTKKTELIKKDSNDYNAMDFVDSKESLFEYKNRIDSYIAFLQKPLSESDLDYLKLIDINSVPIVDFWLKAEEKDADAYTSRMKDIYLKSVLSDNIKLKKLSTLSLNELKKTAVLIENMKLSCNDILTNEDEISLQEKKLLSIRLDSKAFFQAVVDDSKHDNILELQANIIKALRKLSYEQQKTIDNTNECIFDRAKNIGILASEDSDDLKNVDFIFNLASKASRDPNFDKRDNILNYLEDIEKPKNLFDYESCQEKWLNFVELVKEYFDTIAINDFTADNIELLKSINIKLRNCNDKFIIDVVNSPEITRIEQAEFIARYKDNKNFRFLLRNQNIDIGDIVDNLLCFETIYKNALSMSIEGFSDKKFASIISDKFKQLNRENKDINIQGNNIVEKLSEIKNSLDAQNILSSNFVSMFIKYASTSLDLHSQEIQQLIKANESLYSIN